MNSLHIIKKTMRVVLTLVFLLSVVAPAMAREDKAAQGGKASTATSQAQDPTEPAELEAFLDELMAKDMEVNHVPGAAVSVVKDGKLFFAKGYGYAAYGSSEVTLQVNIEAGIGQTNLEVEADAASKD